MRAAQILRNYGIGQATYYAWRSRHGGATVAESKQLKALETEDAIDGIRRPGPLRSNAVGKRRYPGCPACCTDSRGRLDRQSVRTASAVLLGGGH